MAIGVGPFGNIVEEFESTLNEIFGNNQGASASNKGPKDALLFDRKIGGNTTGKFRPENWVGNSKNGFNSLGVKLRYGFSIVTLDQIRGSKAPEAGNTYFLDIPPQSIKQKEIFATNISATRKGIIVESEGVVFKDIIIQGTTGVFPGQRGKNNVGSSNVLGATGLFSGEGLSQLTQTPQSATGVDANSGKSKANSVATLTGYEEFMRLRQFFLRYAADKVQKDGDRFLIFVNEKDDQNLIVEPLEFEMERDRRSPMTYSYRIVLKAIGTFNGLFGQAVDSSRDKKEGGLLGVLNDVAAVSANVSNGIEQSRVIINASTTLLTRFSQALDQTFLNPLRQTQFAMQDLSDGTATILSLPEVLIRNTTDSALNIAESSSDISNNFKNFEISTTSDQEKRLEQNAEFTKQREIQDRIRNDSRVAVPRSFLQDLRGETNKLNNDLADFTNLGDELFNTIKGRVQTVQASLIKVVSDEEFLLMGAMMSSVDSLNQSLASNNLFAADAEVAFANAQAQFEDPNLDTETNIQIVRPNNVREVRIQRGDILERIAQREYGDATRWLDLVVLNNLKPPYIADEGGDGVKKPGETILVGDK